MVTNYVLHLNFVHFIFLFLCKFNLTGKIINKNPAHNLPSYLWLNKNNNTTWLTAPLGTSIVQNLQIINMSEKKDIINLSATAVRPNKKIKKKLVLFHNFGLGRTHAHS